MALKPCKVCGKDTTTYVDICRHCGAKDPFTAPSFGYFELILMFILIGGIIYLFQNFATIWGSVLSSALVAWLLWRNAWWQKAWAAVAKAKSAEGKAARQVQREERRRRREVERERAEAAWKQEQEKKRSKRLEERRRKEAVARELSEIASTSFLVRSCPSCYENTMYLLSVSPHGRSIQYQCVTCNKRERAVAASPRAQEAVGLFKDFSRYYPDKSVVFMTTLDPLPYEQTVREPISDAMRSQVWRRDGAQCVKCGRKENLQLDHIIPVKKGGATTINNLQLLCRSCNLAKGAKI